MHARSNHRVPGAHHTQEARPRQARGAAEAPIELCEENDELDEAPSPPPRRRNRIRRKLRRSTIGGVVGALGPWPTVPWTSLGILLPWTPLFDTLSFVLLFLRSARVDLMERRFREEASTYIRSLRSRRTSPLYVYYAWTAAACGARISSQH